MAIKNSILDAIGNHFELAESLFLFFFIGSLLYFQPQLDIWTNPFLKDIIYETKIPWTSYHYLTWLYFNNFEAWIKTIVVIAIVITAIPSIIVRLEDWNKK